MWTAFPSSLAGRDSGDYYGHCVAIGLAPVRRSHVRLCHTSERDLGVPFVSFNALGGHRSWPRRSFGKSLATLPKGPAPVCRRLSGGCCVAPSGDWDSGNPAFAISRRAPQQPVPYAWARAAGFLACYCPRLSFRIRVSHQAQGLISPPFPPRCAGDTAERLVAHQGPQAPRRSPHRPGRGASATLAQRAGRAPHRSAVPDPHRAATQPRRRRAPGQHPRRRRGYTMPIATGQTSTSAHPAAQLRYLPCS
jgi:hypothetical protein